MPKLTLSTDDLLMLRDALAVLSPDTRDGRERKDLLSLYIETKLEDEKEHN